MFGVSARLDNRFIGPPVHEYKPVGWNFLLRFDTVEELRLLREEKILELRALEEIKDQTMDADPFHVFRSNNYIGNDAFRSAVDARFEKLFKEQNIRLTIQIIDRLLRKHSLLTVESGVGVMTSGDANMHTRHENVDDMEAEQKTVSDVGVWWPSSVVSNTQLEISDFLSRPIQISAYSWGINTTVSSTIQVWKTYFSAPSVRAKLRNYAYIYGNMNVRIYIAGTPFHYGRLMAGYIPQASQNEFANYYTLTNMTTSLNQTMRYLSAVPGTMVLDPKTNEPCDFFCPFVGTKRGIRLFNNSTSALASGSSFNEIDDQGVFFMQSLTPLKATQSNATSLIIYVYAWMTDVVLGPTTGTQIDITTESGVIEKEDERTVGPVEKVASYAEIVAGALKNVPVIGPFALASQSIFSGVRSLAALFGWSVPVMEIVPKRVKNEPYQNAAHVVACDTGKKISLDPAQELTIDPRVGAVDEDQLALSFFTSNFGLLDQTAWNDTDTPMVPTWMCAVNPNIVKADTVLGINYVQPHPLAFSAKPFAYWRGDITFRFDIVASNFHRGKLLFFYEPNIAQKTLINGSLELNKHFCTVIDIQSTQTIDITVPWAFTREWARVNTNALAIDSVGSISNPLNHFEYANGYIGIAPMTKLESNDSSDITINVYVSSSNMRYNFVTSSALPLDLSVQCDYCCDVENIVLNPSAATEAPIAQMHFGEQPVSFRSLLKRFFRANSLSTTPGSAGVRWVDTVVPVIPVPTPSFGVPATTYTDLLSYLRPAFLGMRGSFRRRFRYTGGLSTSHTGGAIVSYKDPSTSSAATSITLATSQQTKHLNGAAEFVPTTNGGIEVQTPIYTNNLYVSTSLNAWSSNIMFDTLAPRDLLLEVEATVTTDPIYVVEEIATGDDFNLVRFIAPPPYVA